MERRGRMKLTRRGATGCLGADGNVEICLAMTPRATTIAERPAKRSARAQISGRALLLEALPPAERLLVHRGAGRGPCGGARDADRPDGDAIDDIPLVRDGESRRRPSASRVRLLAGVVEFFKRAPASAPFGAMG